MTDRVTVTEVPEPEVMQDTAEFITDDWREGPDGQITGQVLMRLNNGRTLLIGVDGIYDRADFPDDPNEPANPPSVNWDEFLQLLDGWRALRRQQDAN